MKWLVNIVALLVTCAVAPLAVAQQMVPLKGHMPDRESIQRNLSEPQPCMNLRPARSQPRGARM